MTEEMAKALPLHQFQTNKNKMRSKQPIDISQMTTKRLSPKKPGHKKTELEELDDLDLGSSLSSMRSKGKKSSN